MKRFTIFIMIISLISCHGTSNNQSESADSLAAKNTIDEEHNPELLKEYQSITISDNSAIPELTQNEEDTSDNFTYPINHANKSEKSHSGPLHLYSNSVQPFQTYSINPSKDTVVTGAQGTIISISANSFQYKNTKNPVSDEIKITLKEYYKISDMLLANLSTMSNGEILETGGIIYLEAKANNEAVELTPDASIELKFPTANKKDDMLLWNGEWDKNIINWELAEPAKEKSAMIFENDELDEPAEFPGGQTKMYTFFSNNLVYPKEAVEVGAQGAVFIGFVVDESGLIKNIELIKGVQSSINREAIRVIEKMPTWKPGKINGIPVSTKVAVPIFFTLYGGEYTPTTEDEAYVEKFEQSVSNETIHDLNIGDISYYLFSTQQLGWINVDKIIDNNNPRIDFTVDLKDNGNTDVKLILRDYNSILVRTGINETYVFGSVPTDIFAKIIAIKTDDSKYYIATKDVQIRENYSPKLEFKEVTMERLKEIIERLNIYSSQSNIFPAR